MHHNFCHQRDDKNTHDTTNTSVRRRGRVYNNSPIVKLVIVIIIIITRLSTLLFLLKAKHPWYEDH